MLLTLVLLILGPASANANVGIPIGSFGFPFMLINLLFVVVIEALVLKQLKKNLSACRVLKQVGIANTITTFISYPTVAFIESLSPLIQLRLGWLLPFPNLSEMKLYISLGMFFTLVPCYFLSVWLEGLWLRRFLDPEISWRTINLVHLASYSFLSVQVFTHFPLHLLKYNALGSESVYALVMWFTHCLFSTYCSK